MQRVNLARLKNCMRRAEKGEELTIGFFGGSITQGCAATVHEKSYAYRVFEWWEKTFPKAELHYVNGGIGGTTSHFGVSRVVSDLLMYQPDMVVVDFSVNDEAEEFFQETYEGVIRRILRWKSKPAILILNNVYYDSGKNAQDYHNKVGEWYQIPCVSMKDTLYQGMRKGRYSKEELTQDGLHPNDRGHELVASEIIAALEHVRTHAGEKEDELALPEPMTANAYENAQRHTIQEISPELMGFCTDAEEKTGHLDLFKNGWIGKRAGDRISFEIEAACIAVQYRKTVARPALRARLILDDDTANARILDGNFDMDWGDCAYLESVLHHGEKMRHRVDIEIIDDGLKQAEPFYLMSIITA